MPLKECQEGNQPGYKWGDSGKCYTYRPGDELSKAQAREKAIKQGRAVEIKQFFEDYKIESYKQKVIEMCETQTLGITLEELGLTQQQIDDKKYWYAVDPQKELKEFTKLSKSRILKLYRYTSDIYGPTDIGPNTRPFCKTLVARTRTSLMRHEDIIRLNSAQPGMGKGGSDSYSVFNWRGGKFCKHIWVKYLYNMDTMNLIKAPADQQPRNLKV